MSAQAEPGKLIHLPFHTVEYTIAHVTTGRFRIKIPRLSGDADYASKLNWLLERLDFVIRIRMNAIAESVIIGFDPSVSTTLVQENLAIAIQQASAIDLPTSAVLTKTEQRPDIDWIERLGFPVASLGLALLVEQLLLPIPTLLMVSLIGIAATPFFLRVLDTTLQQKRLDADVLDALWLSLYTARGDFVGPSLMLSLMETGDALRDATARSNERQVFDLLNGMDQFAWVERDGQERRTPLKEVQRGDRVVVYPGEVIPVSGRILRGTALIDEHKLTGESTLVSRSEGQVVHASTQLLEGKITILTKRLGENTRVGLTVQLLQSAPVHDTRVEDYAGKLADMTIAPTLFLSGAIFALTQDVSRALAPLHLDFSHGIRIAVPSTVLAALTYAARHGIYIRSGRALEMLAQVDTVVFDKTGTLTQGNAAVVAIKTVSRRVSQAEVLRVAASAERGNTHPVASAILTFAEKRKIEIQPCEAWDYRIGFGVVAQMEGARILVGSDRLLQQEGVDVSILHDRYPDLKNTSSSVVYVARSGKLLGMILYDDAPRSESAPVIATLHGQHKQTYILTGDTQKVADRVARQLGVPAEHTHAGAFPDQKVEVIRQLQAEERTVAFVGEGINDAAALAHADVSISFASGIDIARETADVILLDDDLRGVPNAIAIARRAIDIIYQNTALIAVPNISVVAAGIFFALDPVLGVIISNGSALIAELNSFRPLFDPISDPLPGWMEPKGEQTAAPLTP